MTIPQAAILGLVQGLTEFLPVSSSGHLVLFQTLLGFTEPPILFDVMVHLATLLAVGAYFWKRFLRLNRRLLILLIIATLPAVVAGFVIEDMIEFLFTSLWSVALGLLVTSGLLFCASKLNKLGTTLPDLKPRQVLIIGVFQAMAIIPGISRSGSTVSAGLFMGLKREDAFFFSFLMAVPAILGAAVLQAKDVPSYNHLLSLPYLLGMAIATLSGVGALKLLDVVVSRAKLHYFAWYCLVLSLGIMIYQVV